MIVALPGLFSYLFLEVTFSIHLNRRVFVMFLMVGLCFLQDTRNEKPD